MKKLGLLIGDVKEENKNKVAHPKEKERMVVTKICPLRMCFKKMSFQVSKEKKIKNLDLCLSGPNHYIKKLSSY